ncbi:metallopeptidase TldD-related protein [Streptomyces huiliensis]|uniref:metallopeptidase TldD-related protein n=1 Tax=Streptomyces huiliensis TaxID=2876027 RepID=UPI0027DF5C82|nr:metallopeptidase TldD-related protein [Streptomyces huiliensis]MBZ4319937.1 TldD/PmbA family protein [Streptomyces huiliensis]
MNLPAHLTTTGSSYPADSPSPADSSSPAGRYLDDCRALLDAVARAGIEVADLHGVRESLDALTVSADGGRAERAGVTVTTRLRVWLDGRQATVLLADPAAADPEETAALARALARRATAAPGTASPAVVDGAPTVTDGVPAVTDGVTTVTDGVTTGLLPGPAGTEAPLPAQDRLAPLVRTLAARRSGPAALGTEHVRTHRCTVIARTPERAVGFEHVQHHVWHWREGLGGHRLDGLTAPAFADLDFARLDDRTDEFLALHTALHTAVREPLGRQGRIRVLLRPEVAAHLVRSLGFLLCAGNVLSGMRPLLERIGRRIAAPAVTLVDDPLLPGGSESAPVDAEGTPTARALLLEEGRLRGFLTNRAGAAALGVTPTGAARCPNLARRTLEGPSNILLAEGTVSPAELRDQLDDGLEAVAVTQPGRIRGRRGTFVTEVLGWRIRGGRRVHPVGPVRLSLGIFELLRSVEATGNDAVASYLATGARTPSVLVGGMEVG